MTVLAAPSSSARRWTIAGAILIAEYLLISVRFDAGGVPARGGFWALAALGAGAVAALAVALVGTRGLSGVVSARGAAVMIALGGAAWFAGELMQRFWQRSSGATLRLVALLLRTIFSGVTTDPDNMIVTL